MKKSKMILLGTIFFILFVIFQIYMTTSPSLVVVSIKRGYKGIVVSKKQIAQRDSHIISVFSKEENKTYDDLFGQELDSIIAIGDSIVKPINDNYVFVIKPNGQKERHVYTYISRRQREGFRWPKKWKYKWSDASK